MPLAPDAAPAVVRITLRHFAVLRERRGVDSEVVTVAAGTTVSQLYATLFPPGPHGRLPVLFAVDHCYVPGSHPLQADAEVAFIPPLGGG
ncbi:MoaD/ThiS family protein [Myxococcota bacterium]|nr:MoaD/ThiS family protein [Myxococcota bacterium]